MKVAIVGAGVSGLSCAHYMRKFFRDSSTPLELVLFESSGRAGGVFDTVKTGGTVLELGPDSFITSKPWALDLARDLGLGNSLLGVGDGPRTTFVYKGGRLRRLPEGFFIMSPSKLFPFLRSGLFSVRAKLRVLLEPLVPRGGGEDESVSGFVTRRFGKEMFDTVAQPVLGGIYMTDAEKLSLGATMPQFLEMERDKGSVLTSLLRNPPTSRGESGARYGLFLTPAGGMSVITEKLLESAAFAKCHFGTRVSAVAESEGKWLVVSGTGTREEFDAVALAVPAAAASSLLSDVAPDISQGLSRIEYSSSVVASLVFDERDFSGLPDGFGIIVPSTEGMNLAACSLYSNKFPAKCESGKVVVRGFLGGEGNSGVADWSDEKVETVLGEELRGIFGDTRAEKIIVKRYPESMPLFRVGHARIMRDIMDGFSRRGGLSLCGAACLGVGIPDCVRSGELSARKIHADLTGGGESVHPSGKSS